MLWGSALVGSQVIKGIGTLPQYSVGNNSSNYGLISRKKLKNNFFSKRRRVQPDSELFSFPSLFL
jgi:hypothetical protein